MHRVTNIPIICVNPHLTCKLCSGYLIDATTIVECLHSFCRSCIVRYLERSKTCPVCDTVLHKTRPHYAIRPDRALQAIVYKLIPGLFEKEMSFRRDFYKGVSATDCTSPENRSLSPEKRGDITLNAYVIQEDEPMSIELEYWQPGAQRELANVGGGGDMADSKTPLSTDELSIIPSTGHQQRSTYLLCPPDLTVGHLEKLIRVKFELKPGEYDVALFFSSSHACDDLFKASYTLSDLAYLYTWRRHQPMKLYFTIVQTSTAKNTNTPKTSVSITKSTTCGHPSAGRAVAANTIVRKGCTLTKSSPQTIPELSSSRLSKGEISSTAGDPATRPAHRSPLPGVGDHQIAPTNWDTAPTPASTSSYLPSAFANQLSPMHSLSSTVPPLLGSPTSLCSPRA